jgi:hypothetical protein
VYAQELLLLVTVVEVSCTSVGERRSKAAINSLFVPQDRELKTGRSGSETVLVVDFALLVRGDKRNFYPTVIQLE